MTPPCTPTSAAKWGSNVSEASPTSTRTLKTWLRELRRNLDRSPKSVVGAVVSAESAHLAPDLDLSSRSFNAVMTAPLAPMSDAESGGNVLELSPPSSPTSSPTSSPRFRDAFWNLSGSPRMSNFPRRLRQLCLDAVRKSDDSTGPEGVYETDTEQVFDTMRPCQTEPSSTSSRPELPKKTNVGAMIQNSFRKRSSKGQAVVVGKGIFEANSQVACSAH
eukprot:TRINITY_DN12311_c0_g2_i1.p1 TRINITY_DN12311_c0_g2~~TRINITY_DN12311_c0_g2_i1.p1  ORF type:complete len:219 (-),score=14.66 TRINITY_DN12311_c0_g2_i1:268-924(-)